jgi:PEP-CTERM motif
VTSHKLAGLAIVFGLVAFAGPAIAAGSNLVTNGGFESTGSNTQSYEIEPGNALPGWQLTQPNGGDIACVVVGGINNMCGTGYSGPHGSATFAVFPGTSPDGGNFLAGDSDVTYSETISQTITGLTVGQKYSLTFYQAGAQQDGFVGATYDQWQVTFGGSTQDSTLMNVPNGGDVGWMAQTMIFTAASTSQTLAFLAVGGPTGDPPMALLDGVNLVKVPEPASIAVICFGIAGLFFARRRAARS